MEAVEKAKSVAVEPLVIYQADTAAAIVADYPVATFVAPNGKITGIRCVRIADEPVIEAILGFKMREIQARLGELSNHQVARIVSVALVVADGDAWVPAEKESALKWPLASHRLLSEALNAFFRAASVGARA